MVLIKKNNKKKKQTNKQKNIVLIMDQSKEWRQKSPLGINVNEMVYSPQRHVNKLNLNSSNTDCSFTMANSNSFLSP